MNNGNNRRRKIIARILGNFGVLFFSPLVSGNVAESMFDLGITFEQSIVIAFFTALFGIGLIISTEVKKFGESQNEKS